MLANLLIATYILLASLFLLVAGKMIAKMKPRGKITLEWE